MPPTDSSNRRGASKSSSSNSSGRTSSTKGDDGLDLDDELPIVKWSAVVGRRASSWLFFALQLYLLQFHLPRCLSVPTAPFVVYSCNDYYYGCSPDDYDGEEDYSS